MQSDGARALAAQRAVPSDGARAVAAGIGQVCFDRNGYLFHGRVKSLADAARQAGLQF